ncbi:hypothetical protein DXG01_009193 [Tephrocybe rancida]|nr:hypothetical protein DXG01_009193 [Tephrocybe rancida]
MGRSPFRLLTIMAVSVKPIRKEVGPARGRRGFREGKKKYGSMWVPDPCVTWLAVVQDDVRGGKAEVAAKRTKPVSPVTPGGRGSTLPETSPEPSSTMPPLPVVVSSGNDADSDTSSLEIIDMDSLPAAEQLPSGVKLEENIKRDWIARRGVEFPSPPESQARGRSKSHPRAILDPDTEEGPEEVHHEPRQSSPKKKNASLSPLRTLFPYRAMAVDQPFSASPNPSPYSSRSSLPFLSATSLKMSMSTTSISSIKGEGFFSRKFLSFKGKDRTKESLDAWEVVDPHSDPSFTLDNASSPTRSQSFTYGMPVVQTLSVKEQAKPAPAPTPTSTTPHPLSLRDRKAPPVPAVPRPRRQAPPPPPKPAELASVPQGPILTSVRTRKPPPPPKKPPQLISSPLGRDTWRPSSLDVDASSNSILQRAMVTPLPLSPVDGQHENIPPTPSSPVLPSPVESISVSVCEPTPTSLATVVPPISAWEGNTVVRGTSPDFLPMPGDYPDDDGSRDPTSMLTPSPRAVISPSPRRHYPGRPLPQPPGTTRPLVESIYALPSEPCVSSSFTSSHCPEGLLIDLDDSPTSVAPANSSLPFVNSDRTHLSPSAQSYATSSSSSVDLLGSIAPSSSPVMEEQVPPSRAEVDPAPSNQVASPTPYSEMTDLDVLVSQISGEEQQDGSDYDALLLLSEFIGPASPPRRPTSTPHTSPHQAQSNPTSSTTIARDPPAPNVPLLDIVRVERRRTTKDGRVKLKLGLLDAAVDKCGICLAQFRNGDAGQLGSFCSKDQSVIYRGLLRNVHSAPAPKIPWALTQEGFFR